MSLNFLTWGTPQWTLYSIGVGLFAGILGNLIATAATHYREEQARINKKPINWTYELIAGLIFVLFIIGLIILFLIFT